MERRLHSHQRLRALIRSRTQTLVLFSKLAALRPFRPSRAVQNRLRVFCQALTDYIATAHFLLYRFVEDGTERRQGMRGVAQDVYPRIVDTTSAILTFVDSYASGEQRPNLSNLAEDLARLGEVLAERILLEDKLVDMYMQGE